MRIKLFYKCVILISLVFIFYSNLEAKDKKENPELLKRLSYWLGEVKNAEKWFYIDSNGNIVDKRRFENVYGSFDNGYAKVYKDGKWGLCDTTGKIIVEPKFNGIESFREGLARVKINDKYGFVDISGKLVIEAKFDAATYFSEGLAGVLIDNKCGFIDRNGKIVIEPKFDEVYNFRENLALVRIDTLYGFIDKKGDLIIKPVYDDCFYFTEGLAAVKKKDKWGYIDKDGKVVIDFKFDKAYPFSENRALVLKDKKYFFINKEGKPIIDMHDYETMGIYFDEGLNSVKLDEKWGFIDTLGKIIIEPKFDSVLGFSEGLALVEIKDKFGYIDKTGKIVIEPKYNFAYSFNSSKALVNIDKRFMIRDSIENILNKIPKTQTQEAVKLILNFLKDEENYYIFLYGGYRSLFIDFLTKNINQNDVKIKNDIISIIKNYSGIRTKLYSNILKYVINVKNGVIDSSLFVSYKNSYDELLLFFYENFGLMIKKIYMKNSIPMLLDLASDSNLPEELREYYCELIAEFHNKDDFEKLLNISKGFKDKSRFINVLCKTGDERAIDYILPYLETNERDIAWGLRYIPSSRSVEILIKILEHQISIGAKATGNIYGTAYDGAILSLGVLGDEKAIPVLKKALADSNQIQARRLAAWSLWALEDKSGIPVMVNDGHWKDLKIMADPYIVPYVIPLIEINNPDTSIIDLLFQIGSSDAIKALLEYYDKIKNIELKENIAIFLARKGENKVLPTIKRILSDNSKKENWEQTLYSLLFVNIDESFKPILYNFLSDTQKVHKKLAGTVLLFSGENSDKVRSILGSNAEILQYFQSYFESEIFWSSLFGIPTIQEGEYKYFLRKLKKFAPISPKEYISLLKNNIKEEYKIEELLFLCKEIFSPQDAPVLESEFLKYNFSDKIKTKFYLNIAYLAQSIKDYKNEEKYSEVALNSSRNTNDLILIIESLWMLSDAYIYNSKYNEAEKLLKEALEICKNLSENERMNFEIKFPDAYTLYLIGELNIKRKNYKEALKNFQDARNYLNYHASIVLNKFMEQREPRDRLKAMILSGLGVCHTELGKENFRNSVEQFDKVGTKNIREEESRDRAYYGLIRSAVAEGNYEEAQRLTEKLILIKMKEDFEKMDINPLNPERKKEMEELKRRKKEIEDMKREIEKMEKGAESDTIIQKKVREFKKYINKLKIENPKLFTIVNSEPSNLKELQDLEIIPENMVIIQYLMGDEELYMFIVKSEDLIIKKVGIGREKISGLINEYRTLIKNRASMEDVEEYSNELYKYLIEPIESELSGIEIIGIIPNQQLYYLPFSALRKTKEKNYLGEKYRIFYMNSTSLFGIIAKNKGCDVITAPIIAFANADGTLPDAEVEVKNISSLYPEILTFYKDNALKDSVFKITGCKVFHFATHGVTIPYEPTSSYLVLAPKGDMGKLRLEEIWGLDLKDCPLVVLSACETAEGRFIAGDEVVSLAFGFIYAGSSSCVASLWEVASQSTSDLMQEFHKNLKNGKSRIQALQDAQITLLKNPKTSHPFFWAPFILIGDWR